MNINSKWQDHPYICLWMSVRIFYSLLGPVLGPTEGQVLGLNQHTYTFLQRLRYWHHAADLTMWLLHLRCADVMWTKTIRATASEAQIDKRSVWYCTTLSINHPDNNTIKNQPIEFQHVSHVALQIWGPIDAWMTYWILPAIDTTKETYHTAPLCEEQATYLVLYLYIFLGILLLRRNP